MRVASIWARTPNGKLHGVAGMGADGKGEPVTYTQCGRRIEGGPIEPRVAFGVRHPDACKRCLLVMGVR